MDNGEHLDRVGAASVDYPIRTLDDLANVWSLVLRHFAARVGELGELSAPLPNTVDDAFRVDRRGLRDVLVDGREVLERTLRPKNTHYAERFFPRPSRERTSSCGMTRPASTSARPASIA